MSMEDKNSARWESFLPDFCTNRSVFVIVLIAEILAFVLALASAAELADFWLKLSHNSLFIQWVALSSAVLLCSFRRYLNKTSIAVNILIVYSVIQLTTLSASLVAQWILHANFSTLNFTPLWQPYELFRNWAVSSICCLVLLRYFYVQHQWQLNVKAETEARLNALQARIRPHFLFNSMNTIVSLIFDKPHQAEQAILDLSDLFRSNLRQRDRISINEELELARRYLRIEQCRLGNRLQIHWQLTTPLPDELLIPALILQPLLENAVYHGIEPNKDGGEIDINVALHNAILQLSVTNTLASKSLLRRSQGHQMAQENIRQRLYLAYGEESSMTIRQTPVSYSVVLKIPTASER